ncbi:MAG: hypothetical protein LBD62_02425, partial [Candidatus Margulisbacteria bacterium]|nr:hypothetical protein [Candidatus Margulisiibacteriota bacterium]
LTRNFARYAGLLFHTAQTSSACACVRPQVAAEVSLADRASDRVSLHVVPAALVKFDALNFAASPLVISYFGTS